MKQSDITYACAGAMIDAAARRFLLDLSPDAEGWIPWYRYHRAERRHWRKINHVIGYVFARYHRVAANMCFREALETGDFDFGEGVY